MGTFRVGYGDAPDKLKAYYAKQKAKAEVKLSQAQSVIDYCNNKLGVK